jgi:hypothetical protein
VRDVLPKDVLSSIQHHLRNAAHSNQAGAWRRSHADEDAITGDFCGRLSTDEWQRVAVGDERWEWRVEYQKVRGRGPGAPEKQYGADGIFLVDVFDTRTGRISSKGLVFQAKKGTAGRAVLEGQVRNMEERFPGSSAVFVYDEHGFKAQSGRTVLEQNRAGVDEVDGEDIGTFLSERFIPCYTGLRGLYYSEENEIVYVFGERGDIDLLPLAARHRIDLRAIRVQ